MHMPAARMRDVEGNLRTMSGTTGILGPGSSSGARGKATAGAEILCPGPSIHKRRALKGGGALAWAGCSRGRDQITEMPRNQHILHDDTPSNVGDAILHDVDVAQCNESGVFIGSRNEVGHDRIDGADSGMVEIAPQSDPTNSTNEMATDGSTNFKLMEVPIVFSTPATVPQSVRHRQRARQPPT